MTTGTVILTAALYELGVIYPGEAITADLQTWGLEKLNDLIDSWRIQKRFIPYTTQASYAFAASQRSYTIGRTAGMNFDADRPLRVDRANYIYVASTPDLSVPIEVLNVDSFSQIPQPATAGTPTRVYYQATIPNGTLWPYPYPTTVTDKIELWTWAYLSGWAALGTDVNLAPGYAKAIKLTLAEEMADSLGRPAPGMLAQKAREARSAIASLNTRAVQMVSDLPNGGPDWNHLTGNLA